MPVSIGLAAAQFGGGALQKLFSGKKKAERDLEKTAQSYQTPGSILDYYNKSLNRYSANPYTSQFYQQQQNQIQRNLATGIGASQDRRGGLATVGALTQGANDASARAGVTAEGQQNQALSQLGAASRLKAGAEDKKYDLIFNLKALKAGAANQQSAAGWQNMFGGLGSASELLSAKQNAGVGTGYDPITGKNKRGMRALGSTQAGSYLPDNGLPMGGY